MAISKEDVKYVASLARIEMTDKELEDFTGQLDTIMEYMKKLNQLDTDNVPPTSHILDIKNIIREDKLSKESLSNKETLKMAPDKKDEFFKVPKVIE